MTSLDFDEYLEAARQATLGGDMVAALALCIAVTELLDQRNEARRWAETLRDNPGSFWSNDKELPWSTDDTES